MQLYGACYNSNGSHLEQFCVVVDRGGVVRRGFALFRQHHVKLGFLVGFTTDEDDATVFAGLHQDRDQVSNNQEMAQIVHLYTRNGGSLTFVQFVFTNEIWKENTKRLMVGCIERQ